MTTTDTLIIGGGQAGLALSHCLSTLGRDHLVIERGRIAQRWHHERWSSLRLLTPNWMTRLPGWAYDGPDPDGFMAAAEVASFFDRYAASFAAPVREHTAVRRLEHHGDGFVATTDDGPLRSRNVVIATGWCDRPAVPAAARHLSPRLHQLDSATYRSPDDVAPGGVLVVGASATGVQLAHELHTGGHEVTLAVGRHSRMPRRHRGMDIFWWLDLIGSFDRTIDDMDDATAARTEPSLQLVGRPDHADLDLPTLQRQGVRLVGRVTGADGRHVTFGTDVAAVAGEADRRMAAVLRRIDCAIDRRGLAREVLDAEPIAVLGPVDAIDALDLHAAGIRTVVWATGHRRPYEWLRLPILDRYGEIVQRRGVTPLPGAYVLGQRFQHFRNSNFIDGVGRDARYVAEHICATGPHRDRVASTRPCQQR